MDEDEGKTDGEASEIAGSHFAVSSSENHEDEQEGSYNLDEEGSAGTACSGDAVTAKTGRVGTREGYGRSHYLREEKEEGTGYESADDLADPIAAGILPAHAAGECNSQRDGRIDVAA